MRLTSYRSRAVSKIEAYFDNLSFGSRQKVYGVYFIRNRVFIHWNAIYDSAEWIAISTITINKVFLRSVSYKVFSNAPNAIGLEKAFYFFGHWSVVKLMISSNNIFLVNSWKEKNSYLGRHHAECRWDYEISELSNACGCWNIKNTASFKDFLLLLLRNTLFKFENFYWTNLLPDINFKVLLPLLVHVHEIISKK